MADNPESSVANAPVRTEALGRLAAGIAHDLNGMLAGIGAAADLLARRATPRDQELLAAISEQTVRAGALIRQLMAFAREEQVELSRMDLADLARGLASAFAARAEGTALLEWDLAPAPADVDRLAIERVLINILGNALEAMRDSGAGSRIVVASGVSSDVPADAPFMERRAYATLSVADDGPGIPADIAHRIFEPYFSTRPDGHGLGLASAFGLVKQHGGYLLHDQGPLGGARFRLFLPVAG